MSEPDYSPFFDQEGPEIPIRGLIAEDDISPSYELDAAAVFDAGERGYLVVVVSGCSCWPDYGSTEQHICADTGAVDRALAGDRRGLLQKCQDAGWKASQLARTS